MNLNQIVALGIALISFFGGRLINEKALKLLTNEERGMLIQSFSKSRIWSSVILMIIIIGYLTFGYTVGFEGKYDPTVSYFVCLVVFMVSRFAMNYRKLKSYNFTPQYYRLTLFHALLNFFALACIAYSILSVI